MPEEVKIKLWNVLWGLVVLAFLVSLYEPKEKKKEPRWEEWI